MSRKADTKTKQKRAHRSRPTPKWLKGEGVLEDVARRRALMILSVLSGEKPVTDAVAESGMSRMTYYQLETKALAAMVQALSPSSPGRPAAVTEAARIRELEEKVKTLEMERRRAERLLYVTRKLVRPGKLTFPRARATKSAEAGKSDSPGSKMKSDSSHPSSTPTPTGESGQ
jgi:hypothetical protein